MGHAGTLDLLEHERWGESATGRLPEGVYIPTLEANFCDRMGYSGSVAPGSSAD